MIKKEDLVALSEGERFISGIYNYCDRWCERCSFTSRCMHFAASKKAHSELESFDIENDAFWRGLSETFQVTLEWVEELAKREGIDLSAIDVEAQGQQDAYDDAVAEAHSCCRMGKTYSNKVDEWFDAVAADTPETEDRGETNSPADSVDVDPAGVNASCHDALAVVRWYQHHIFVKLMRAVRGQLREEEQSWDEFAKDSDGSAKVALIGIERSIAAWGELRRCFFQHQREIADILVLLEALRRNVEDAFPAARDFIRPGFDRVNLNG